MITAIIFDCFGVLSTEGFGLFRDKYLGRNTDARRQANEDMDELNSGRVSYGEYTENLAKLANVSVDTVSSYLDENKPNELLFEYIRNNLKPHYKIGMLSNAGNDWLKELFEQKDIDLFDDIVLSYKIGLIKPQQEIFALSTKRLGVAADECIFIDDQEKHIEGARQAGLATIRYQDFEQMKTDLEKLLASDTDN